MPTSRYSLGVWRGVPIEAHASLLLILGLLALRQPGLVAMVVLFAVLLGVVLLHEAAHAAAGALRGYRTRGLFLHAFGGLTSLHPAPASVRDDLLITLAGPLSTLALGTALVMAGSVLPLPGGMVQGVRNAGWIALYWASFNLLPAYPMDGGRLLQRTLALRGDPLGAAMASLRISQIVVSLVGLYGLIAWQPGWIALAAYLYLLGILGAPEVLRMARNSAELGTVSPPPYARRPPQRVDVTRE